MDLTKEQFAILEHTAHRAARGRYCGDSPDMRVLVAAGLMTSAGKAKWCPDEYFSLTQAGLDVVRAVRLDGAARPEAGAHAGERQSDSAERDPFRDTVRKLVDGGWRFEWDLRTGFIGACHPRGGKQTVCEIHGNSYVDRDRLGLGITKMLMALGTPDQPQDALNARLSARLRNLIKLARDLNWLAAKRQAQLLTAHRIIGAWVAWWETSSVGHGQRGPIYEESKTFIERREYLTRDGKEKEEDAGA